MDQLKVAMAVMKKYHFWILSVLVLAIGLTVWFMATESRATAYKADLAKIEGADKSLSSAAGENPPNASFKEKVDKLHDGLKQEVADVWKRLYERQIELFVWPEQVADSIAKLAPGEAIPERIRAYYNDNVVRDEWKRVFDLVDIRRPKGVEEDLGGGGDGMGMPGAMMPGPMVMGGPNAAQETEMEGIVFWDKNARAEIVARYYSEKAPPSDLKMRLTQEDLWIFENALVAVVEQVNANAHDSLGATIKQIQVLDLAQWAINAANESGGRLWKPGDNANGASGMGPAGMPGMGAPGMGMPGAGGEGMMPAGGGPGPGAGAGGAPGMPGAPAEDATSGDAALLANRYLDDQGKPMQGDGTGPFAEFKQMFVYMRFIMDQRKLPDLLAACANAPLPIETRQVRVHIGDQDKAAGGGGGFGNAGMPGAPGDGGMRMPDIVGAGGMNGASGQLETGPYDVVVELSGIIYLYNPPQLDKLGTGSSSDPSKRSFSVPTAKVAAPGRRSVGIGMGMPAN